MKKPSGAQTDRSGQSLVDVAAIDGLAKLLAQYDLSEIEISLGDLQVRLARERALSSPANVTVIPPAAPAASQQSGADHFGRAGSPSPGGGEIADGRNCLFASNSGSEAICRTWIGGHGRRQIAAGRSHENLQ